MERRSFLKSGLALGAASLAPRWTFAADLAPTPAAGWRTFEVVTRIEILKPAGATQVWIPVPGVDEPAWFKPLGDVRAGNASSVQLTQDSTYGARMIHAVWDAGTPQPALEVSSRFATRDRATAFGKPAGTAPLAAEERALYLAATELVPTDGIVRKTADEITRGARTDLDKARAIYDWVVDNTFRDPKTRGCGIGNVKAMLETGNLGGKCADLNALYVGLARAAGLPARDVYGVRVAPSKFGYKSLGAGSPNITKAQHCRAEVWLAGYGWVPVDPADVRKVVLEEPPKNLALDDPKVQSARRALFGAWEMNWLAYNVAHDVRLPGSSGPAIPFLMYPQAETGGQRLDSLDPDNFRYTLTAKEIAG
jgi:transglutaminase-like putative cysteine protease